MLLTWSGPEGSSHTNLCLCVPFFILMTKEDYMRLALKEAIKAKDNDEVPIGCVIVLNDKVIARGHNHKVRKNLAVAHAEIEAITKASKKLGTWHLDGCEMYVTLEPCLMCAGAIVNSRIAKVYYGASDPKGGAINTNVKLIDIRNINHYPESEAGILEEECSRILTEFFKSKR